MSAVPIWRREPYRLLFPMGVLMAWAGVLHWLLLALGVMDSYRSIFHSLVQIEGFMSCFAVGFLFTLIPRRTGGAPPAAFQMLVAMACPVAIAVAAWHGDWGVSQAFWLVSLLNVIAFAAPRFARSEKAAVPDSFVWVAAAGALAFGGSLLAGLAAARGAMWLHDVGRAMVVQGVFACLVTGVGGMLIPVVTRGEPPPASRGFRARAVQGALALLFAATFLLEPAVSMRLGFALRSLTVLVALLASARMWKLPRAPGLHRKLVWISAWMMPIGFASVAAFPGWRRAGLHVVFLGCFALMAFAISVHVVLSHGGRPAALGRWPRPLVAVSALLAAALVARVLVDVDAARFSLWLGTAAACFLAATLFWGVLVVPAMRGEPVAGA